METRQIIDAVLSAFNISPNGKQIYLLCFEKGESPIGRLAEDLQMDRSSAYLAVDQLKSTGLIEIDETRRPKLIRALEPRRLLGNLERKIQSVEDVFNGVHDNLKLIEAAYGSSGSRPALRSYSGKEGLQQIVEDILSHNGGEILLFTNPSVDKDRHPHQRVFFY